MLTIGSTPGPGALHLTQGVVRVVVVVGGRVIQNVTFFLLRIVHLAIVVHWYE